MLCQHSLKCLRVSTDKLVNLVTVLEHKESRHGANSKVGGQVWQLIHVKLDELDAL
jgi:hypothetical protein